MSIRTLKPHHIANLRVKCAAIEFLRISKTSKKDMGAVAGKGDGAGIGFGAGAGAGAG